MNQAIFDTLIPLYPMWRTYVEEHFSPFTNQQYEVIREAYAKMYGPPPRNLHCRSCIDDLLKKVFYAYEEFKNQIQPIETKTKRKRNGNHI